MCRQGFVADSCQSSSPAGAGPMAPSTPQLVVVRGAGPAPTVQCMPLPSFAMGSAAVLVMPGCWGAPAAVMPGAPLPLTVAASQPAVGAFRGREVQETRAVPLAAAPEGGPACAEEPALTRGARRRMKQRLRKKLGKLERQRAAECAAEDEEQAEEVPVPEIDEIVHETSFDLPVAELPIPVFGGAATEKIVPVCAVQKDVRLDEDAALEVVDLFVALPPQRKGPPPPRAASGAETPRAESDDEGARSARSCPAGFGSQLPVANTFVHFPLQKEESARRRSLSV